MMRCLLGSLMVVAAISAATASRAQSDDDLGTQPISPPSAADLGVVPPPPPPPPPAEESTEAPTPAKKPTPAPAAPVPTQPAQPAQPAAPKPDKAAALSDTLRAALHDLDDSEPKALLSRVESAANSWIPEGVVAAEPAIKPLSRLVRARQAILQNRLDDAETHLRDAGTALDSVKLDVLETRRLREAIRFFRAQVADGQARNGKLFAEGCGRTLGIRRLAKDEAQAREALLEGVAAKYAAVARGPDRFWGRRAAFMHARLSEDIARLSSQSPSYRTVALPLPYSIDEVDSKGLLDDTIGAWVKGLKRAYAEILQAIDARDPDPDLAERVRVQAAALGRFDAARAETSQPVETAKNPWVSELHQGLVRMGRRAERYESATRSFVPMEHKLALEAMNTSLKESARVDGSPAGAVALTSVDVAYAMAGLATATPDALDLAVVEQALSSSSERTVVAALIAAERTVSGKQGAERAQKLLQPVLTAVGAAFAVERASPPFSTLQDSLYGSRERALLALLALSRADRQIIDVVVDDERVPLVERAWLAAEIADARLAQRYDSWGYHKDERMAALAVWGGVTARGRRFAGYLLRPDNGGLVGCVSRALIAE